MNAIIHHPTLFDPDILAEDPRAPQTQFVPERQVAFLEALAVSGSVRSAARRAQVSHQTCYRARRNSAAFGRAWDAALVIARGAAEAHLADYAMHGVEEEVWYHGEHVGTRRRVSDRLLLAHLARLDRMRSDARIEALAEDFDALLGRMRRGEPIEPDPVAQNSAHPEPVEGCLDQANMLRQAQHERGGGGGDFSSHGQCNTRSMSPPGDLAAASPAAAPEPPCDCPGAADGTARGVAHFRRTGEGWQPVSNSGHVASPCCDAPRWPRCRDCPHYPPEERTHAEMHEARPDDAPSYAELTGTAAEIEECQADAFACGDEDWWRYGAGWVLHRRNARGCWVVEEEDEACGGAGA